MVEQLKSRTLSAEDQRDYLRYLIHMVGDMHCPMHAGHRSDLGRNTVPVKWFGAPTNLHSIWDSKLVDSCRPWSYSEWTANIDRNLTKEDHRPDHRSFHPSVDAGNLGSVPQNLRRHPG